MQNHGRSSPEKVVNEGCDALHDGVGILPHRCLRYAQQVKERPKAGSVVGKERFCAPFDVCRRPVVIFARCKRADVEVCYSCIPSERQRIVDLIVVLEVSWTRDGAITTTSTTTFRHSCIHAINRSSDSTEWINQGAPRRPTGEIKSHHETER